MSGQADIDALLAEAETLAVMASPDEASVAAAPAGPAPPPTSRPSAPPPAPRADNLERILHIDVPVIVKLAECHMPLQRIIALSPGAILEFNKPADDPLELMINNKCVGLGLAVKVGENFGLRITEIGTLRQKIEAMKV